MAEEQSERLRLIAERKEQMRVRLAAQTQVVRVEPANEDIRRVMKHPNGRRFPPGSGSVEWPLDGFTGRRIADGSVTVVSTPAD